MKIISFKLKKKNFSPCAKGTNIILGVYYKKWATPKKLINFLYFFLVVIVVVVVFVEYICLAINSVLTLICCSSHN